MIHVALVTTSYPDGDAGRAAAGAFVQDLAEALARHVQVSVVAPAARSGVSRDGPLTVHRFAVPKQPLSLLSPAKPGNWLSILYTLASGSKTVERLCREGGVDHLLALWALPSGYWARRAGRRYGIPYAVWALGSDIWSLGTIPGLRRPLKAVLRDSRACFADGELLRQEVQAIGGRGCEFLPSVRRLKPFGARAPAAAAPYRLAFLGRWHPNKGVDLLFESLSRLNAEDWCRIEEVRICGGGPLEAAVGAGCRRLQAAGRPVTLRGYLDKAEATELLEWADYLLLPSRIESIPVVFSDAVQAGRPLVAMPVGDLPALLREHELGVLAAEVSAEGFAAALRMALATSPRTYLAGLDRAGRLFSVERTAERLLALLGGDENHPNGV